MSEFILLSILAIIIGGLVWFEYFYKGEKEPIEEHEKIW